VIPLGARLIYKEIDF